MPKCAKCPERISPRKWSKLCNKCYKKAYMRANRKRCIDCNKLVTVGPRCNKCGGKERYRKSQLR